MHGGTEYKRGRRIENVEKKANPYIFFH